jgi:hypothetical protein
MTAVPAYQVLNNLEQSIRALRKLGQEPHNPNETPDEYRDRLRVIFQSLKTNSALLIASSNTMGFHLINDIDQALKQSHGKLRLPDMNEVFWDELANHYPPSLPSEWGNQKLSPKLQLKLSFLAIEQRTAFGNVIEEILADIPEDHFMDAFTGILARLTMPYRKIELGPVSDALFELKLKLEDPKCQSFQVMVADHMLAHQDVYFPVVEKLMAIHAMGKSPDKETAPVAETIQFIDKLLSHLDHTAEDIRELRASGTGTLPIPFQINSILGSVAFPAEFLVTLYEASQHPTVMQWAEFSFEHSEGHLPFKHFERIGLVRSPEWHQNRQETAHESRVMTHFEHALHTPEIELRPKQIATIDNDYPAKAFMKGIRILEEVDLRVSGSKEKAQVMFDAMVERAQDPTAAYGLMDALKASSINPRFFARHPKLRGELLETKLGL